MARSQGQAGEWARVKGTALWLAPVALSLFLAGFAMAAALFGPWHGLAACAFFACLASAVWALVRGLRRIGNYFKGARGEERVAALLSALPEGFRVYNDFPACGRQIDHVVIGPTGVFAVETKNWSGAVTLGPDGLLVDGTRPTRPPLEQALVGAGSVRDELAKLGWKGDVKPLLVFASDTFAPGDVTTGGVRVMNATGLLAGLSSGRRDLEGAELDRLVRLVDTGI